MLKSDRDIVSETCLLALVAARTERTMQRRVVEAMREQPAGAAFTPALLEHPALAELRVRWRDREEVRDEALRWLEGGGALTVFGTEGYPGQLAQIALPPFVLWRRGGDLSALALERCVAVVGSRRADQEGIAFAFSISKRLSECGVTIASGLALGIDTAAHKGALEGRGACPTVAVLGGGLGAVYPPSNRTLCDRIVEGGGVVISEYPPDESPRAHHFLERNRIIAGLALGTIIVQAPKKSGSLATARNAVEEGREVLVLPGSRHNENYVGSHALIRSGATLVTSLDEILEAMPRLELAPSGASTAAGAPLSEIAQKIMAIVPKHGAVSVGEVLAALSADEGALAALMALELEGILVRLPGNQLARGELELS